MNSGEPAISDEQLDAILDGFAKQFPAFLDLFGKKASGIRFTKTQKVEARTGLKEVFASLQELRKFQQPPSNPREEIERVDLFSNTVGKIIGMPKGMHLFEYGYRQTLNALRPPSISYLSRTNYDECRKTVSEIAQKLHDRGLSEKANKLFEEFGKTPDASAMTQFAFTRLSRQIKYLCKAKRKLEKRQIAKFAEIYLDMSGLYEKVIRIIVGLLEMLEGKETSYASAARNSLSSNLKKVEKSYPILTRDFNTTIRNGIAHPPYFIRLSNKTIRFVDRRSEATRSFKDFSKACRSLSALVLALGSVESFIDYLQAKKALEDYKAQKSSLSP